MVARRRPTNGAELSQLIRAQRQVMWTPMSGPIRISQTLQNIRNPFIVASAATRQMSQNLEPLDFDLRDNNDGFHKLDTAISRASRSQRFR